MNAIYMDWEDTQHASWKLEIYLPHYFLLVFCLYSQYRPLSLELTVWPKPDFSSTSCVCPFEAADPGEIGSCFLCTSSVTHAHMLLEVARFCQYLLFHLPGL